VKVGSGGRKRNGAFGDAELAMTRSAATVARVLRKLWVEVVGKGGRILISVRARDD
jgi:hypothetical protein